MQGVLQGIMNPEVADIAGGLRRGGERRQQNLSQEMVGNILKETIGGKLGSLGEIDPQAAIGLAEAFQIPVGQEDRIKSMFGDAQALVAVLQNGGTPQEAAQLLVPKVQLLESLGIEPTQYIETMRGLNAGDPETIESLFTLVNVGQNAGFLKSPQQETEAVRTLRGRAELAGLEPGSKEFQEFIYQGGPSPKSGGAKDQRDRKIKQYMELYGLSQEDAVKAVDAQVMTDDKGNAIVFDPITQKTRLLEPARGKPSREVNLPEGVEVEELSFDPAQGTGFGAAFLGLYNSTLGQLPFAPIATETAQTAQNLRVLERDAIRALASSNRPPVIEQQRIASIIPQGMDPFQNPEEAQFKMTNFVDLMMNQYVDDLRFSTDSTNPKKVREDSSRRAREIESVVRRVLTPEAANEMFRAINGAEAETSDLRAMNTKDLLKVDPTSLSPAQLDIYTRRLQELKK